MNSELRTEVRYEVRAEVGRIYHRAYVKTMATICWVLFAVTWIVIIALEL